LRSCLAFLNNLDVVDYQSKRAKGNVDFPPDNTVNDLRNFGFDFAAIMETGEER
jgi:hypothetical protein